MKNKRPRIHDIYKGTNALPDHTRPARLDASAGSRPRQKESLFAMASASPAHVNDLSGCNARSPLLRCMVMLVGRTQSLGHPTPNHLSPSSCHSCGCGDLIASFVCMQAQASSATWSLLIQLGPDAFTSHVKRLVSRDIQID